MLRLVLFCFALAAVVMPLSWLADRPGSILINWQGYEITTTVFEGVCILALVIGLSILAWSILVQLWRSPASIGAIFSRRRQMRGLEALSAGMIAIGAGDRALASRYALQARKTLPNEPLTHLLRAQAAQLSGDSYTSRRIFEAMLGSPETEQLGLRGLFLEAEREGETEAQRQFAERALRLNPKLGWPVDALFELQCKDHDWEGALRTLDIARKYHQHEKSAIERRRAVLLTARAQMLEDSNPEQALQLALEAHHLAHELIPAAAIAGRILAGKGNTKRAARVIERTWRLAAHPDLATAYAFARTGDSPRDRLERVRRLAQVNQHSIESPVAIASAAIDARDFVTARRMLEPLEGERQTQRVCTLMARVEAEEFGDRGRVREWLARAVHAPRDPAWTADGVISDKWAPVSPVTGALDAFQWRVPVEALDKEGAAALTQKLDELVKLTARDHPILEAEAATVTAEPVTAAARTVTTSPESAVDKSPNAHVEAGHQSTGDRQANGSDAVVHAAAAAPASKSPVPPPTVAAEAIGGEAKPATATVSAVANGSAAETAANISAVQATSNARARRVEEARIFVAPRPPDDPGLEDAEPQRAGGRHTA
ncbi:MAG: heme biosynthesis HemY N-terminal domain-containing protein [Hyphomicrobiaceae bacterium]